MSIEHNPKRDGAELGVVDGTVRVVVRVCSVRGWPSGGTRRAESHAAADSLPHDATRGVAAEHGSAHVGAQICSVFVLPSSGRRSHRSNTSAQVPARGEPQLSCGW